MSCTCCVYYSYPTQHCLCTAKSLVLTWGAWKTPQVSLVQPEHFWWEILSFVNLIQVVISKFQNKQLICIHWLHNKKTEAAFEAGEIEGQGVLQSQELSALSSHGLVECWNNEQAWKRTVKKQGPSPAFSLLWAHAQCWGFSDLLVRTGVIRVHLLIKQWPLLRRGDCYAKDWGHNCQSISPVFHLPCSSKAVTGSFATQC